MKKSLVPLTILLLMIIGLFVYINRFILFGTIEINGYALNSDTMLDHLQNGKKKKTKKVTYEKVKVNDTIYLSGNRFFVGEKDKKYISSDYPIISKDSSTLLILDDLGKFVDEKFIKTDTYRNSILVDSHLYNGANNEQVDDYEYYFVEMNNGVFSNIEELTITVKKQDIVIPINSFIYFRENGIRYYMLQDGNFIYKEIPVVDSYDKANIGKFEDDYIQLLYNLGILQKEKNKTKKEESELEKETAEEVVEEGEEGEKPITWIEPEVILSFPEMDTYSFRGNLTIKDPSGVMVKSPTFEFNINGKVYIKKTINSSGNFIVDGLLPNTTYEVIATYIYRNASGKQVQRQLYSGTLSTLGIESLDTLVIKNDNISSSTNSILLEGLSFENDHNSEILKGIKTIEIVLGEKSFNLDASEARKMIQGDKISYETPHSLETNTEYTIEIRVLDVAKNQLPIQNNIFHVKTKKSPPTGEVNAIVGKNFTKATLEINLNNKDKLVAEEYKYIVYEENGEIYNETSITENTKKSEITGLDTAKKYVVKVFCNYYDEEGIKYENYEIATTNFITYDIEKQGSVPFNIVEVKEGDKTSRTPSGGVFNISYSNYNSDDVIYSLLDDEAEIQIIDDNTNEIVKTIPTSNAQFKGLGIEITLDDLESNTVYRIEVKLIITSGTNEILIKNTYNNNKFQTLKKEPVFEAIHLYIAAGYINFDAVIYDKDQTIADETAQLDVYDETGKRVYTQELEITKWNPTVEKPAALTNVTLSKMPITGLYQGGTYTFKVTAANYDDGATKESNREIQRERKYKLSGTYGSIALDELLETPYFYASMGSAEGKNLFNIKNNLRWKSVGTNGNSDLMTIKRDNNVISLSAKNGYRIYSYYVPELIGRDTTISFKARKKVGTQTEICIINGNTPNCNSNAYRITPLTDSYDDYVYTFNSVSDTGYISFYIYEKNNANNTTTLEIKDLQIEEGLEASTPFRNFEEKNEYSGIFTANVDEPMSESGSIPLSQFVNQDSQDNINEGDYEYYIRFVCTGTKCKEANERAPKKLERVDFPIEDKKEEYNILANEKYVGYLSVYDPNLDRYYDISEINFVSDREIRTIKDGNDFYKMHSTGYYIATKDIDLRNNGNVYNGTFQGNLDFQGHQLLLDTSKSYVFSTFGGSAILQNVDIHYYYDKGTNVPYRSIYGLFADNYGTVMNAMFTLETMQDAPNTYFSLIAEENFGTIKNFVINSKVPLIGSNYFAFGPIVNYGTIKNGYIIGSDIDASYENTSTGDKNVGEFACTNTTGATIKNVYTIVDIQLGNSPTNKEYSLGSIVASASNSEITNAYVFSPSGVTKRDTNRDIMFGSTSNVKTGKLYYVSNVEYNQVKSKKEIETSFKNMDFQNNVLNEENMFLTKTAWKNSIFPQLDLPSVMPEQEYIKLPDLTSSQSLKVLSVDKIDYLDSSKNNDYIAEITLSLYNANRAKIQSIKIDGIAQDSIKIVKQATNDDKITILIFRVKEPNKYISEYNLSEIRINTGVVQLNSKLNIDLYKPVETIDEINHAISDGHQNFKLIKNIDCNKDNCTQTKILELTGKLDGDHHTISNLTTSNCFIERLSGQLSNINFSDLSIMPNGNIESGLICNVVNTGMVDNVHVKRENIEADVNNNTSYIGGLVASMNNGTIQNSSVQNLTLNDEHLSSSSVRAGGLVGTMTNSTITNSFVRKMDYPIEVNRSDGIGGIVGRLESGNVKNVYATGSINTNGGYIGGIVGYNTGRVNSAIAKINIVSEQDYIGEIAGSTETNTLSKTLALGNLTTTKENPQNFDRSAGVRLELNGNYVWDKQVINSMISDTTNGETILTEEELANPIVYSSKIGLDDSFEFADNFRNGYIPAIRSTNDTILRNQGISVSGEELDEDDQDIEDLHIKYEELFKYISSEYSFSYYDNHEDDPYYKKSANVTLYLSNIQNYEIESIQIDGLTISNLNIITEDNVSKVTFKASPNNYYDSYTITKISYFNNRENKDGEVNTAIKLEMPFYGQIRDVNDWQELQKGTLENYIVLDDIDFTRISRIKYGFSFNHLHGMKKNNETYPVIGGISEENALTLSSGDGFIDTISGDIKNLSFQNINIKSTSSGNYIGLIKFLTGTMSDITFDNIVINAPNINYLGIISFNQSPDIRNILITNSKITGKSYVGGLIGRSLSYDKTNIRLTDVEVSGAGNYVGGLLGYENWDVKATHTFNVNGERLTVSNSTTRYQYTGGIFGYGAGNVISLNNSTVTGYQRVGGISGEEGNRNVSFNYVNDSTIQGKGWYIGGITGINQNLSYAYVKNTTINGYGTGTSVGGISGHGGWTVSYSGIQNSHIVSAKDYVGGIKGTLSWGTIHSSYVKETDVNGVNKVGGITGRSTSRNNNIYYTISNATIIGTGNSIGGVIGFIPNLNTNEADNITRVHRNIVANSFISGGTNVGGLIGNMENELYKGHFYQNVISSDVKCTADSCQSGYVIGWRNSDASTSQMTGWKIYQNSTLNGTRLGDASSEVKDQMSTGTIINRDSLKTISTYSGFPTKTFQEVEGKYPKIKTSENDERGNFIVEFDLPPENSNPSGIPLDGTDYTIFPSVDGYAVDADKINITFGEVNEKMTFKVKDKEYSISDKTFTFYYDFKEDVEITLSDGTNKKIVILSKDYLQSRASIVDGNYYYIDGTTIESGESTIVKKESFPKIEQPIVVQKMNYQARIDSSAILLDTENSETPLNNAVNIYNNKILLEDMKIYNIESGQVIPNYFENLTLVPTKPVYQYIYNNQKIETFDNYSIINGEELNQMVFIVNSEIEVVRQNLKAKPQNILVDNYNGDSYFAYVNGNGKIVNLKDPITYPKSFKNYNIKSITTEINKKDKIMLVEYENGNYIVFNYLDGTVIANKNNYQPSIIEYMKEYISLTKDRQQKEKVDKRYIEAKEMVSKLKSKPINAVIGETKTENYLENSNYSIVFNSTTGDYSIYEFPVKSKKSTKSIIKTMQEQPISEVIDNDEKLVEYYKNIKPKKVQKVSSFFIIVGIIGLILITIISLKYFIKKLTKKKIKKEKK